MRVRSRESISPRQSPSSLILASINSDGDPGFCGVLFVTTSFPRRSQVQRERVHKHHLEACGLPSAATILPDVDESSTVESMRDYYVRRATYYERVYLKPERQHDLRTMEAWL